MIYPTLSPLRVREDTVETFLGYRRAPHLRKGEFYDMENMSSDGFPLLCTRQSRGKLMDTISPGGLLWKEALVRVDDGVLLVGDYPVLTGLCAGEKTLISMGSNILVFPDKYYVNTLDLTDCGPIEAKMTPQTDIRFSPATAEGVDLPDAPRQASPPENPIGGDYWVDTSGQTPVWKVFSGDSALWTALPATYIRLAAPGVAAYFAEGDGVTLTGIDTNLGELAGLEGQTLVVENSLRDHEGEGAGDWLLFAGVLPAGVVQSGGGLTLSRLLPAMDLYLEAGNRLWGCRYGLDADGRPVNEIYASKLGDFRNFHVFRGLSTDSYAASLGSDGPFTGAVSYLGMPTFFKEGSIHTVWGSLPENFRLQSLSAPGVARGSGKSLCTVGSLLYYLSPAGVMRYDGALPEGVGEALGDEGWHRAVGGDGGDKYYLSVLSGENKQSLFVYDTKKDLWHREDGIRVTCFASGEGRLYAQTDGNEIWLLRGLLQAPERFSWMLQTGPLYPACPEKERLLLVALRYRLEPGGCAAFLVRYDGQGEFERVGEVESGGLCVRRFLLRPKACDYLELRMEGEGGMRLYALTQRVEVSGG